MSDQAKTVTALCLSQTQTTLLKKRARPLIELRKNEIVDSFYTYLEGLDEFRTILGKYERNKLEHAFGTWLLELFHDKYKYASGHSKKRKARCEMYHSLGIPMLSILRVFRYIRGSINHYISKDIGEKEPVRAIRLNQAINKALDIELLLISGCYSGNAGTVENVSQP